MLFSCAFLLLICFIQNIFCMQQGNQGQQQQNPPQFHISSHLSQQAQQSQASPVVKAKVQGKKFAVQDD